MRQGLCLTHHVIGRPVEPFVAGARGDLLHFQSSAGMGGELHHHHAVRAHGAARIAVELTDPVAHRARPGRVEAAGDSTAGADDAIGRTRRGAGPRRCAAQDRRGEGRNGGKRHGRGRRDGGHREIGRRDAFDVRTEQAHRYGRRRGKVGFRRHVRQQADGGFGQDHRVRRERRQEEGDERQERIEAACQSSPDRAAGFSGAAFTGATVKVRQGTVLVHGSAGLSRQQA